MSFQQIPSVSDNVMWDIWMSMFHNAIIAVALELKIFESLRETPLSNKELSNLIKLPQDILQILIAPLIGLGLISKRHGQYSLTLTSQNYLLADSPFYWGPIFSTFQGCTEYQQILQALNKAAPQALFKVNLTNHEALNIDMVNLANRMHATLLAPATNAIKLGIFKSTQKLLDIGGGLGGFSVAYLQQYPNCNATIFDTPQVCNAAKDYLAGLSLAGKIKLHAGDFFIKTHWPTDCDGMLFSRVLHEWPIEHTKTLLKYAYQFLPKGGAIYIHEMFLNEDRTSPLSTACLNLTMFIKDQLQQLTQNDIFELMSSSGFKYLKSKKTFGYYTILSAIK